MFKLKAYFWKEVYKDYRFIDGFVCNKDDYIEVYIFKDKKEMWAESQKITSKDFTEAYEEGFSGKCYTFNKIRENTVTGNISKHDNCLGYIFLNLETFHAGTIAHECGHAVIRYFNSRIKRHNDLFIADTYADPIPEAPLQETFCYMLGSLVNQINNYYYKYIDKE